MKKVFLLPILFILPLSGCINDNSSKEYSTPELFLSHATVVHHYLTIHSSEVEIPSGMYTMDYDFTIKNKILDTCTFEKVNSFKPTTEVYMAYKILLSNSTAGPNYTNLYIYDDGATKIEYKLALGRLVNYYFMCDAEAAHELNVFTINWLEDLIQNSGDSSV